MVSRTPLLVSVSVVVGCLLLALVLQLAGQGDEPRPFAGRYHATAAGQTGAVFVCDTMTGECWYASVGGKWRSLGRPDEKAENRAAIPAPQP